ncbi:MAG: ROK family protein [Chloroflexi bacterium]|nr:ROK family protein [Anaerolineae bacterium]RLC73855.1 MAG: ROK family protein [Chloroflexota bacterium]
MGGFIVAVDLGGTQIRTALCREDGTIIKRISDLTRAAEGLDAVLDRLIGSVYAVLPDRVEDVEAIGVAAPGPLDPRTGVVISAGNLPGWTNVPLKNILEREFGVPAYAGNDANVAALAEQRFGAGQGIHDLVYITVSTGIGGGIIVDDRMVLGSRGLAAEVGHQIVFPDGPRCTCGGKGCLEAISSGPAIAAYAVERISAGEPSVLTAMVDGDLNRITARLVNEAAQAGDALAQQAFHRAGFYLGLGIISLMHILNPAIFILGGSVALHSGNLLWEPMHKVIRERAMSPLYWEHTPIVPAALGDDVGLLGALALVLAERGTV